MTQTTPLPTKSMIEWSVGKEDGIPTVTIRLSDLEEAKAWMTFLMESGDENL
jgi:hypothetical protein